MPDLTFAEILPEEERKYYYRLPEHEKELLEQEFPRVYLKNGALLSIPEDVYWLSQGIYWESRNVPAARKFVGWTARNRKELGTWGTSYESVLTSGSQFSPNIVGGRESLINGVRKNPGEWKAWLESVEEATNVDSAPDFSNPIPGVKNFYSPVSMEPPGRVADWAPAMKEVKIKGVDTWYFRFFKEK